jgi:hypothetical protein
VAFKASSRIKSILIPLDRSADLAVAVSAELATDIGAMRVKNALRGKMSGHAHVELAEGAILVQDLALSLRDLDPAPALELDSSLLPRVPLKTRAWKLQIRSTEPFRGEVRADGTVVLGDVPLEVEADVTVDACVLGSFDVTFSEALSARLSAVLDADGEFVQLRLALEGELWGDIPRSDLLPGLGAARLGFGFASGELLLGGPTVGRDGPADDGAAFPGAAVKRSADDGTTHPAGAKRR